MAMSNINLDSVKQQSAVIHLENALDHRLKYTDIMSAQNVPRDLARSGRFNWNELTEGVKEDIEMASNPDRGRLNMS